ncbi:GxxExxY protein [Novipirellula sp. SH528]|uniref:GxxExxY protein n=1 Tax=Novipirellula sp. SH528 TaxID=3454466 RepID=UPI003F9F3C1E
MQALVQMPIICPIEFAPLSTEDFGPLDYAVMEHAYASHKYLGSLADETVYQWDFWSRLHDAGYNADREVPVSITFESFRKDYFLDLVVVDKAVYELKTVSSLTSRHLAQLLNYLLLLDLQRGKIINFRPMSVDSKFVNAPLSGADRRRFTINSHDWRGPQALLDLVRRLLVDWGTGLEMALYEQAIMHLMGGDAQANVMLDMSREGKSLGLQRFHLATPQSAFRLTTFIKPPDGYASQLSRLLRASPLDAIHWINISYHEVIFTTIVR